jgi:alpha-D-ribose 1-methylphosphonate 5-triphosphate synthase subunit PhnI
MSTERPPDLISKLREQRLKDAVRRDLLFLLFAMMAYIIVGYVETHASDADIRLNIIQSASSLHHHSYE